MIHSTEQFTDAAPGAGIPAPVGISAAAPARTPALRRPELLAPAGDWECAKAAVENGADAIYFGLDRFNARMRAHNFTLADLPPLLEFLHRRSVKAFVTFNILVFPAELDEAEGYLRAIISAGVDAAIVQDAGICRLIRQLSPDFPIHASTQMTISSAAGLGFADALGCSLVALARECSIPEMEHMQASQATPTDLEVFVHGALCVAYSGQCLTSEALGGRSANRGVCAQACRLPYDLISDGRLVALGDKRYLLSPRDLAGLDAIPDLIRAGVKVFKIEGRLKRPEYVANITRVYRDAIDRICAEWPRDAGAPAPTTIPAHHDQAYRLEMAFSRGLYTGWLRGINNQQLVHARFGKKRGVYLGQVARLERDRVAVALEAPLKPGDGIVFDAGHPDQEEEGGRVYTLQQRGHETWLSFGQGDVNFERVQAGDRLWKTSDPALDRQLRQTFAGDEPQFLRPVDLEVEGSLGQPLRVRAHDDLGHQVEAQSDELLLAAVRQPLTTERLRQQLGRLGGTAFHLAQLENRLSGSVFLPVSALNEVRRRWVSQLDALRALPPRWILNRLPAAAGPDGKPNSQWRLLAADLRNAVQASPTQGPDPVPAAAELIALVRSFDQMRAALDCGVRVVYCDFEDPKRYREAVQLGMETGSCTQSGPSVWLAPPRIFKAGEDWILKQIQACNPDGFLLRNYDHLRFFAGQRVVADFSFNIANALSAGHFMQRYRPERVTAAYDLDETQLGDLLESAPPQWFEVTIHHHMPMFHMEHCVFCAFLSSGTDYTNCGRPCEKHTVQLRDRVGAEHPIKADAGCRNTVFHARAQTGAESVAQLISLGLRFFRVEFLDETPGEVSRTIGLYRQLLRGELDGGQLWRELKLFNHLGITRGPE